MEQVFLSLECKNNFVLEEAYKFLRTNLLFCGQDIKAVTVTSCNENEGKTSVSVYLAKSLAELGKRTLIVDADMRKSVMASRYFKKPLISGLSELLTGIVKDINTCLYKTDVNNLFVLFAGKNPPNPSELLASKYFDAILAALKESFDYIIIDTPPLVPVTDAAVVAPKTDGTLFVVGTAQLNRKDAVTAVEQLKNGGAKILGVVRNNIDKKRKYYSKKNY